MNASNWKDGKATIAKILYKVQSYGKTFYEIFSFNSWKTVEYLCRNVTIDQWMTIFKSNNFRHAHSRCARYFILRLGHNMTIFLIKKYGNSSGKSLFTKHNLRNCCPIRLDIFFEGHFHISLQSISAVSLWFAPTEILYVRELAIISKSEKSTSHLKRRKLSKNKNLLSQEHYESNRDFLARIARLDLSPGGFNIFYIDIITL